MAGFGGRLLRGRSKQATLLACAVAAGAIVVAGKADPALFDRARADLSDWTAPALTEIRAPLVGFEQWAGNIPTIFAVYRDNIALRRENAELRKWQNVALSLENRLYRYDRLLNVVPDPAASAITARVIGESNRPFVRTMILDAGAEAGVKKGQAVLDERGLLGRVYVTGARTSWVILLTDLDSRVPVIVEPGHRRAILVGDNTPAPVLEHDVGDGPVKPGDRVLSTSDGGMLPPDIPIGTVMSDGDGLRVTLLARAESSDYVHVLDYAVPAPPTGDAAPPTLDLTAPAAATAPEGPLVARRPTVAAAHPGSAVQSSPDPSAENDR
jgi:rod shape-determining protein MreC